MRFVLLLLCRSLRLYGIFVLSSCLWWVLLFPICCLLHNDGYVCADIAMILIRCALRSVRRSWCLFFGQCFRDVHVILDWIGSAVWVGRCTVIFLKGGLGWGMVLLFHLVACMLHVGGWLCMCWWCHDLVLTLVRWSVLCLIFILFYTISDNVLIIYRDRMFPTMFGLSQPDDNYLWECFIMVA